LFTIGLSNEAVGAYFVETSYLVLDVFGPLFDVDFFVVLITWIKGYRFSSLMIASGFLPGDTVC
jgi:hypothetical protein